MFSRVSFHIAFVLFFLTSSMFVNGGFVSSIEKDVTAPVQKVAISWDGEKETMILATKFESTELTRLGWIIPIKAMEKLDVELGDINIFYDLSEFFGIQQMDPSHKRGLSPPGFGRISILETKESDICEIAIFKAADVDQLYEWLRLNRFKINRYSENVLGFYTNEDLYFIAVKIDLPDKYKGDMNQLKQGLYTLKISFKNNQAFFPLKISSINPGKVNIAAYIFAKEPHKDKSDLLSIFKWQPLTKDLKLRLSGYLPLDDLTSVTRLTFKGQSSHLVEDAFFCSVTSEEKLDYWSPHYKQVDFSVDRLLREASINGDVDLINRAIANGADVNNKSKSGLTPLYAAATRRNKKAVEVLIRNGADINSRGFGNQTSLHKLAYYGHRDMIEFLINNGADVNAKDESGYTPLYHAADNIIELLVSNGADINAQDNDGSTPLHVTSYGIPKAKTRARLLIALGADLNAPDNMGSTPLHHAGGWGRTDVAGVLVANGADLSIKNGDNMTPSQYAKSSIWKKVGELLEQVEGRKSVTSLHDACWRGDIEQVKAHILQGADVNARDKLGRTPLHIAAAFGHEEIARLLISKRADVNGLDGNGRTALHEAAKFGQIDMAELLVNSSADANICSDKGQTPVEEARKNLLTSYKVYELLAERPFQE